MKHSILGASSAARWMACPGSVRLTKDLPDKTSTYAEEGTAAHALAEHCLRRNQQPSGYIGGQVKGMPYGYSVTKDMVDHVQVYLDTVRGYDNVITPIQIEQKFSLEHIHPGMFGANDASFLTKKGMITTLHIFELKYGAGVAVEVEDNIQLKYYALGALHVFGEEKVIDNVELVVVQPRKEHPDGFVRKHLYSARGIERWGEDELSKAASATEDIALLLVTGQHCQFCRAFATCPQQREEALSLAKTDFADVIESPETVALPAIEKLSKDELVKVMQFSDRLAKWSKEIAAHIQERAERGEKFEGFKLVRKKSDRAYISKDEAEKVMARFFDRRDFMAEKIIGIPAAEKLIKKHMSNLKQKERDKIIALWHKPEGGLTLAPDSDKRKEIDITPDFLPEDEIFE